MMHERIGLDAGRDAVTGKGSDGFRFGSDRNNVLDPHLLGEIMHLAAFLDQDGFAFNVF